MRRSSFILALAAVCLWPIAGRAQDQDGFEARSFQGSGGLTLPYRLFKVQNPTPGTQYPVILFLHGAGERGDDNTAQLTANAGARVWATPEHQAEHPAYVIAPQCPAAEQWVHTDWTLGSYSTTAVAVSDPLTTALEIVDAVATEFGTDPARQYITGLSMGGYGTWDAIIRNPTRFAAAIPICGAGDPSQAALIADLPIWTTHGDADDVVPVSGSRDMVTALMAAGSTIEYSEYPGVGHNAWDQTYANEEIIDWLFQFQKETPVGTGGSAGAGGLAGSGAGGAGNGGAGMAGSDAGSGGASASGGAGSSGTGPAASGTTGLPAAGSAGARSQPTSEASSCSYRPRASNDRRVFDALLLSAFLTLLVTRRSARRAAQRHSTEGIQGCSSDAT